MINPSRVPKTRLGKFFFIILCAVLVVFFLSGSYFEYQRINRLKNVIEVEGKVITLQMKTSMGAKGNPNYCAKIKVSYTFDSKPLVSNLLFNDGGCSQRGYVFNQIVKQFEPNQVYKFYVNIDNPVEIYDELPSLTNSFYVGILLALILSWFMVKIWTTRFKEVKW